MVSDLRKICRGYRIENKGELERMNAVDLSREEIREMIKNHDGNFPIDLSKSFKNWLVGDIGSNNDANCHRYIENVFEAYDLVEDSHEKIEGLNMLIREWELNLESQELIPYQFEKIDRNYFSGESLVETVDSINHYIRNREGKIISSSNTIEQERKKLGEFRERINRVCGQIISKIGNKLDREDLDYALNSLDNNLYFDNDKGWFDY